MSATHPVRTVTAPHPEAPHNCLGAAFSFAPWRLSGTVYAALLNDPAQVAALGDAAHRAPYKAPPQGPVLAVRPRNTLAGDGQVIALPKDSAQVRTGPSLGIVIGRTACRLPLADAMGAVAGYLVANDLCLPLASHYRPAVREMARDGFCPLGQTVVPRDQVPAPDALAMQLAIDGRTVWRGSTRNRLRGVADLVSATSEFITLRPGDVLLLGIAADAPVAAVGQTMTVQIEGIGQLHNALVAEAA